MSEIVEQVTAPDILHVNGIGLRVDDIAQQVALFSQRLFGFDALHRITDRANQQAGIDASFHQVILGAFLNHVHGDLLVVVATQDDDRHLWHA